MKYADLIIPYGRQNDIAVNFVVENIKTRIKELGIKLHQPKPLAELNSDNEITVPRVKQKDVYGVVEKLFKNKENEDKRYLLHIMQFRVTLTYLTQKLLGPLIRTEKLGRNKFEVRTICRNESLDKSKIQIIFHYALLTESTIKKLNKAIEKVQNEGANRIAILSYYSTPEMISKIKMQEKLPTYILMNNVQVNDIKSDILKEDLNDYESSVKEQLSFLTY